MLDSGIPGARSSTDREALPPRSSVLGPAHPLVETLDTLDEAVRQALVVAAMLVASAVPALAGAPWAQTTVVIAATMFAALCAIGACLRRRGRRHALELILQGRECLPIAAVDRERDRLLNARCRLSLAESFEGLADEALSPATWPTTSLFQRRTVAAVSDDLREVGSLLRSGPATARGVALAHSLLADGVSSPLHRGDVGALGQELTRIRFLLTSAQH